MQESVKDSRRGGIISKEPAPIFEGPIRRNERTFSGGVPIQCNIEEIIRGLFLEFFAQEQVIDDQQIGFGEELVDLFSAFKLSGFEEVLEKAVGFPVDDFIAPESFEMSFDFSK